MPTKLYIPGIKDTIKLAEDWTFTLHEERRNSTMWALMNNGEKYDWMRRNPRKMSVTLGADTELVVDRVYIRNGLPEYSSITFRAKLGKKSYRFWAKLDDVNKIVMV